MKTIDYWNEYKSLKLINNEDAIKQLDPFGEVATDFITNSDAYLNFCVGSIRSGKTIAAIVRFLRYIKESPYTEFAMAGKNLKALKRNVLRPMKGIMRYFGIKYYYHKKEEELDILNLGKKRTISLYGIEKKGSDEPIKGSTYAGALLDEVTIMDVEGAKMMISRNSEGDSKIFLTCNPGNPNNFVYQEYVNNKELQKEENHVKVWNFLIDDNKSLSESYKRHIKSIYPKDSLFYKRNILGLWASGQGLIYSRLDENNYYDELKPLDYYDYLEIGSDYGSSSTTCYNLIGIKEFDDHNEYDIIAEDGYNAEKEGISLTDDEIVQRVAMMQDKYELDDENIFYPSHDAKSFKTALEKDEGIRMKILTFTPDTLECIAEISSLIYKNYIRIHTSCTNTIHCLRGYEWDSKAAARGEDKPRKVDDHYADSIRAPIMNHLFDDDAQLLGGVVDFREVFS